LKEEFCITDLWAAEAYLVALDAGETGLLKILDRGEKIHNWMLQITTEKFPKEVQASHYSYHEAKQTVHALNYGVEPNKMSIESKLPVYVCEWQYNFYHKTYPGIKLRQVRIERELETNNRTLTSPLGRKRVFLGPKNRDLLNQAYAWPSQSCIGELAIIALTKIYYIGEASIKYPQLNLPWVFPTLDTHDGLVTRCYIGQREAVKKVMKDAFNIPIKKGDISLTIPITIGWGNNFNDIIDKEVIRYE